MDFKRIRGYNATKRCKNIGKYGSPLYCDCGCQIPKEEDQNYKLKDLRVEEKEDPHGNKYLALTRYGKIVGMIDKTRKYIVLDNNEYMGVTDGSRLSKLFLLINKKKVEKKVKKINSHEKSYKRDPNICPKCLTYCYGDCES